MTKQEKLLELLSLIYDLDRNSDDHKKLSFARLTADVDLGGVGVDICLQDNFYKLKEDIFEKLLDDLTPIIDGKVKKKEGENSDNSDLRRYKKYGEELKTLFMNDRNYQKVYKGIDHFIGIKAKGVRHEGRIEASIGEAFPGQNVEMLNISKNEHQTANADSTHLVKLRVDSVEKSLYVKSCAVGLGTISNPEEQIDPRELFLYKLLELIGSGPKVHFIIKGADQSYLGSIARGSYIMTEEVVDLKIDNQENRAVFQEFKKAKEKDDAVEISRASLLADLLYLKDVFEQNTGNYGLAKREDRQRIIFVDHLPGNPDVDSVFSCVGKGAEFSRGFSAREALAKRFKTTGAKESGLSGSPNYLKKQDSSGVFEKMSLAPEVNNSLFVGEEGFLPLDEAIEQAQKEIFQLIGAHKDSFTPDAANRLESYIEGLQENIKAYKKTEYYLGDENQQKMEIEPSNSAQGPEAGSLGQESQGKTPGHS